MLQQAIEAEVAELLSEFEGRCLVNGRAAVVRSGHQPEREIQRGIGPLTVGASAKSPRSRWKARNIPLGVGAPVRTQEQVVGGSASVALSQRRIEWLKTGST